MRAMAAAWVLLAMLAGCGGGGGSEAREHAVPAAEGGAGASDAADEAERVVLAGNPERGAMVFETCAACHALHADPEEIYFGPPLAGIIDADVAADPEFAYSDAMRAFGGQWTEERLAAYLRAPEEVMPGTEMFQALPDSQDVWDVIAYLRTTESESGP